MDDLHSTQSLPSDPEIVSPTPSNATSAFAPAQATSSKSLIGHPPLRGRPVAPTPTQRHRTVNFNYKNAIHYNVSTTNCSARSSTTPSLSHPLVNVSNAQPRVAAARADLYEDENKRCDNITEYWDCGDAKYVCEHCGAMLWYAERKLSLCCGGGKVTFPFLSHISRMSTLEANGATNHTTSGDEHPADQVHGNLRPSGANPKPN